MVNASAAAAPGPSIMWPWVWVAVVVAILAAAGIAWWLSRRRSAPPPDSVVWVANSAYLSEVPAFTRLMRRYRLLQGLLAAALLVAAVGVGAVAARPVETEIVSEQLASRDITLCVDVSGSMYAYADRIFELFSEMAEQFEGERIALSIFNSTSRTVFPLTDDYALVQDQFREGIEALDVDPAELSFDEDDEDLMEYLQFTAGTLANEESASLVGDGLANCALLFDENDKDRSRSIILATDNLVYGEPIYTLQQAADLVDSRDITLLGIWANTDPGGFAGYGVGGEDEFRTVVEGHDGPFFTADDASVVTSIVDEIMQQQEQELDAEPEVFVIDLPRVWFLVAVLGVAGMVLTAWRVRE